MRLSFLAVLLFCTAFIYGAEKKILLVSIVPQVEIVQSIAGPNYDVRPLIPPGLPAEHVSPNRRALAAIDRCALYFGIGTAWEKPLLQKMQGISSRFIDCSVALQRLPWSDGTPGNDPHVWLSIPRIRRMSNTVLESLCKLFPGEAAEFRQRHAAYNSNLEKLHRELATMLKPLYGKTILVYHPSFAYFLDDYGMKQTAVENHGHEANASHLHHLLRHAEKQDFQAVFVQPQFSPRQAKTLAQELKLPVFTIDPLPEKLSDGLRAIADTIVKAHAE